MTIYYPDVASWQAGISFSGSPVAMVKATQGTGYANPDFVPAQVRARAAGAYFGAYHFLECGNGSAQADHAFAVVSKSIPLMLDWESYVVGNVTYKPTVADAQAFVNRYRALGGTVILLYMPNWFWKQIGSPSLSWFAGLGMHLVSSDYVSYSDTGPGWVGYGGMTVAVWQYTSTHTFNGFTQIDFNAYLGTIAQFISLVTGGITLKPEDYVLSSGATGAPVVYLQQRLNVWGYKLGTPDGDFGPDTLAAVRAFQLKEFGVAGVDGIVGPDTWAALDKTPAPPVPVKVWKARTTGGMYSLADFAKLIAGTDVATLLKQTIAHYGALDAVTLAYLAGLATGFVLPSANIVGATFWIFALPTT